MKHSIKLAWRHLTTNRLFTFINVIGTSTSLLSSFLLIIYLVNEFSFDKFFTNYDKIYRLNVVYIHPDREFFWPNTPPALANFLPGANPGIEKIARLYQADFSHRFRYQDAGYIETRIFYADSLFLEILDYPLIAGDRTTALDFPNAIVLTRRAAEKYFGTSDALGKQLLLNNSRTLTVTGVLEDIPKTSHLDFDFLASFSTFEIPLGYTDNFDSWRWNSFTTYVTLNRTANKGAVEQAIRKIWHSNMQFDPGDDIGIDLQPINEIYLNSALYRHPYLSKNFRGGNLNSLYALIGAVAVLLLISVFNFTNISMATFFKRAKIISINKILGSRNVDIIGQLILESIFVLAIASVLAVVTLGAFNNYFSELIGYPVLWGIPLTGNILGMLLLLMVTLVLLSVIYPIIVMRKLHILKVMKEGLVIRQSKISGQQLLTIFQICITATLLSSTFIIKKQLDFLSSKNLGFEKENVIVVQMLGEDMALNYEKIRDVMLQNAHVVSVSRSKYTFDGKSGGSPLKQKIHPDAAFKTVAVYEAHFDFLRTAGITLLEGRDFSPDFPSDSAEAIILNQAAVKEIGLTGDIVGTEVTLLDWTKKVIGVVEDFNYTSLHSTVGPLVIVMPFTNSTKLYLKVESGNPSETIASLEKSWKDVAPDIPFDYTFLDQIVNVLYKNDARFSQLISLFAIMAIATACLGLIGISWFSMNLRLKEITIRKILGAGLGRIIALLTRQFIVYLIIALIISIPLCSYVTRQWLEGFAYRINSGFDAIVISISILTFILIGLLFFLSGKLALINPVKNLRNE